MTARDLLKDDINNKEAVRLLASILNMSSINLLSLNIHKELDGKSMEIYHTFLDRVKNGYPIEYALKSAYFYGLNFYVDEHCLIPRDETEELVEWVLKDNENNKYNVLDLCCGSGCIGISLKKNREIWNVTCSDIDINCIKITKQNAQENNVDIKTIDSDLFENINESFDIIVSNPPYIAIGDPNISVSTNSFEPHMALYTKDSKGLEFYIKIFDYLKNKDFKSAYFEFGFEQRKDLEEILKKYPFKYEFRKDINNKDRMLKIAQ